MRFIAIAIGIVIATALPAAAQPPDHAVGGMGMGSMGMGMGQGPGGMRGGPGMMRSPVDQLKEVLAKANVPLSQDQEKKLKPIADEQQKQREHMFEQMRGQMGGGREGREGREGADRGDGRGPGTGGGRGMGGPGNNPMAEAMRKLNEDFQAKVVPILTADQQGTWKQFQNDQIRQRGGFEALKLIMEEGGAPLTAEQTPQIQGLYQDMNRQRGEMFRGMQGPPGPARRQEVEAKFQELESATLAKVVKLLNPAQRKALLESRKKQSPQ